MTGYDPKLVADVLVNLFGAFGVLVVSYNLRRSGSREPVLQRMRWALRLAAAFFGMRCVAWATNNGFLLWAVECLATVTPLVALVVAEGLLRRHAPRWMKTTILGACVASLLIVSLPVTPQWFATCTLLVVIMSGFAIVGGFLLQRDRASLTDAENQTIRRFVVFLLIMVPLIATDFRSIWPDIPVRFGAVGVLALLFFSFGPGSTSARWWERTLGLAVFSAIAFLFAWGYAASGQNGAGDQLIRAASVGISGLICAAMFAELLGAQAERRKNADPLLDAATAEQFLYKLKQHAVIGDAQLIDGPRIQPLRHAEFDTLVAETPVLRSADAPWGRTSRNGGVERAMSLLKTYDATHILRLSTDPMRLVAFKLPQSSTDARLESEIKAAQRIGEFLIARDMPA